MLTGIFLSIQERAEEEKGKKGSNIFLLLGTDQDN